MRGWLQVSVAGFLLFLATILVLLAVQGRMNYLGTRGVPVLSWFFSDPDGVQQSLLADEGDGAAGIRDESEPGASAFDPGRGERAEPDFDEASASGAPQVTPAPLGETDLPAQFDYLTVDAGVTAEEIEAIARQARDLRDEAERRLAIVAEREADLAVRERDLADRDHAVRLQIERLEQDRRALDDAIEHFRSLVIAIEQDEYRPLLQLGGVLANLEVDSAVKLVIDFWEDDAGGRRDKIVKTLALMDGSAELRHSAHKILRAMPHERLKDLLEERLKVVDLGGSGVPHRGK